MLQHVRSGVQFGIGCGEVCWEDSFLLSTEECSRIRSDHATKQQMALLMLSMGSVHGLLKYP